MAEEKLPRTIGDGVGSGNPNYHPRLIALSKTCGVRGRLLTDRAGRSGNGDSALEECAALAEGAGFRAFSLGKSFLRGHCYGETLSVSKELLARWARHRADPPCLETGSWVADANTDFYALEESIADDDGDQEKSVDGEMAEEKLPRTIGDNVDSGNPNYHPRLLALSKTCGTRGRLLTDRAGRSGNGDSALEECAALAEGAGFRAFSLGKSFLRGHCYGEMLSVSKELLARWAR